MKYAIRDSEIIKRTRIAQDFCTNSRRPDQRILDVFVGRDNAEFGQKDWQDGSFYFFRGPYLNSSIVNDTDDILLFHGDKIDFIRCRPPEARGFSS